MARRSNEQTLEEVIHDLLRVYRLEGRMVELDVVEAWRDVMGPSVVKRTTEVKLRDGVLSIYLNSAVLKEEFSYQKQRIIDLLNNHMKKEVIKRVEIY